MSLGGKSLWYNRNMKAKRRGFTLIELSLSLVFIGTLSILMVVMIQNAVSSYQRGMTLNKINTTGMDLVDEFRMAVQNSSSDAVTSLCVDYYNEGSEGRKNCLEDGADSFTRVTKYADVTLDDGETTIEHVPVFGAFCTGSYSYIWNSGYFLNDANSNMLENETGERRKVTFGDGGYAKGPAYLEYAISKDNIVLSKTVGKGTWGNEDGVLGGEDVEIFRLLKVRDDTRAVCVSKMRQVYSSKNGTTGNMYMAHAEIDGSDNKFVSNEFDIRNLVDGSGKTVYTYPTTDENEVPEEILARDNNNDLVLYDLYTAKPAISSTRNNMFYAVSFIVGTVRGGINIKGTGQNCIPPADYAREDFDYCAINKFNFAAQASGDITR